MMLRTMTVGALGAAIALHALPNLAHASPPEVPGPPAAATCADIEVIFARGTFESAGVGAVGQAFVDALRARTGTQRLDVYAVNYPASLDFARAADGVVDASNRIRDLAARCPATDIVLGGYSQGAAVSAYVTADTLPAGYTLPNGITDTLPAELSRRIDAVALFGTPSPEFVSFVARQAPPIVIGAAHRDNTIELCALADPVCQPGGDNRAAHSSYTTNGMVDQAADFTVRHLHDQPS